MDANIWKKNIIKLCEAVGTYKDAFVPAIEALAQILEQRDLAYTEYLDSGAKPVVEKVSDRGRVNLAKNPRLQTWQDLNTQALAYWRDLGLTPAGLKKIDEAALKPKKQPMLAEVLKELGA